MNNLVPDYVLGLLEGSQLVEFETAMAIDSTLQQEVLALQTKLLPLDETALQVEPSFGLWGKIEQGIATPVSYPRKSTRFSGLYQNLKGTGVGIAIAACLMLVALPLLKDPPRTGVAVLVDENANVGAIAEIYGAEKVVIVALANIAVPADKVLQVWTLQDKAKGPVSLGLMASVDKANFKTPPMDAPIKGQLYEITLEPKGGSPLSRPTGKILYKGNL